MSSGHKFQTGIKLCRPENTDEFLISRWCFFGQLFCILSKAFVGQAMASKNKSQKIKKIGNVHNFVLLSKSHLKFRWEVFKLKTKMAQFAIKNNYVRVGCCQFWETYFHGKSLNL